MDQIGSMNNLLINVKLIEVETYLSAKQRLMVNGGVLWRKSYPDLLVLQLGISE